MLADEPSQIIDKFESLTSERLALLVLLTFFCLPLSVLAQNQQSHWRLVDFSSELATAVFLEPMGNPESIRVGQKFAGGNLKLESIADTYILVQYLTRNGSGPVPASLVLNRGESLPMEPATGNDAHFYQYRIDAVVADVFDSRRPDGRSVRKE